MSSPAQTPAATPAPNPDAPSVRIGGTIFADFTDQTEPEVTDANGDRVDLSAFNITRAYLNVTGNLNRRLGFRITPDIVRESGTGSSLNGSYTFRLKYAYAQLNLDEWWTKGSYIRFGMQQTPYNDFIETAYRYRFQGPIFADREGFISASDLGVAARYAFPNDYGDVHFGIYNGETFSRAETNDQKSIQARVSFKPAPKSDMLKGLTVGVFYNGDNYVSDAERTRFAPYAIYAASWGTIGFEGLATTDQTTERARAVDADGFSVWATPKFSKTWEALVRYDRLEPDTDTDQRKSRAIAGVAYWIPNLQRVSSAIMLDSERVNYDHLNRADETRFSIHMLVNF